MYGLIYLFEIPYISINYYRSEVNLGIWIRPVHSTLFFEGVLLFLACFDSI